MEKSCEPKEKRTVTPSMHEPEVTIQEPIKENDTSCDTFRRVSPRGSLAEPEVSYHEDSYSGLDELFY